MPAAREDRTPLIVLFFLLAFLLLGGIRTFAGWVLEFEWWKELGQRETLMSILLYTYAPALVVGLLGFILFWIAHARGMKAAGTGMGQFPIYAKAATLAMLLLAYLVAASTVSGWTLARYLGASQLPAEATAWSDPVFGHPLSFYLFTLPVYRLAVSVLLAFTLISGLIRWLTERGWKARLHAAEWIRQGEFDLRDLDIRGAFSSVFVRAAAAAFLLAIAATYYLDRYDMLTNDHSFMVGIDWVDENIRLPIKLFGAASAIVAIVLVFLRKWVLVLACLALPIVAGAVIPNLVQSFYVRPNEISIQRPYVQRHIEATRRAFSLDRRTTEREYQARIERPVDLDKHKPLLDNVRLWDWRAFHDTVTQIQALRPYYSFADTDVDRYMIDGQLRQVLLTPRELDVRQLSADAQTRWMNPHFIYTHGYGLVMAEANRITADGLPLLFVQDAPAQVKTNSVKLTRPEIYYGEIVHEPVFVRTDQQEFNYPSGSENVHSRYDGKGGFPISPLHIRLATAITEGDWNILLTGFLTPESRIMIRRNVKNRLSQLADFLSWDDDPYLVITKEGRMVWMVDAYTTSRQHPYARRIQLPDGTVANYMRNAVKATVDAYDGTVRLYVFDPSDPIVQAYRRLFPRLFEDAANMPADLREHARYPETLFLAQAEIYRNFHMRDPEAFYNKEDAWDIARTITRQDGRATAFEPTYVVATLPGEQKPEFLLLIPFTPRNKDNLIGFMAARCDGDKLGELLFLQLSKQQLIFGPMQVEARINQDQNISKDLTLWNQQGSQVLQGQMLVLPVDDNFIYIKTFYLQSSQARMPQLKKVAMAMGNSMAYEDTYEQALAQLTGMRMPVRAAEPAKPGEAPAPAAAISPDAQQRLDEVRRQLQRYRELMSQGKWVEAGAALQALEAALKR
ncbi:MAG: UPF0182 family protein [Bryobacteraceae bacterium]|nr:UPF0182 family protein [Bryobacteraceae bacterium]